MNKTAIKNFAIWARNKLITDISYRAGLMGITADGIQKALPQSTGTTEFYDIGTAEPYSISGDAVKQRKHLVELIQRKEKETNYKTAYKYVLEEVAYTWFNRLIAVRFMEVNDYLPSHIRVLSSDSGKMEPDLVTNPFSAGLSFTPEEEQAIYQLKQENKLDEVFRILFIRQCNALNENLPALFEKTSDYTELLLNLSVIDQDGVVYHLVHDIPEEDFDVERGGQVEIIGWLYQYYIYEKHEEVIDPLHGKTVKKEEVPAATQLFTTDWVVRYLIDNSLGKYWIDRNPESQLESKLTYYIKPKTCRAGVVDEKVSPQDMTIFDPCVGSGHFLIYAFDLLMSIYEEYGYSQRDAATEIVKRNLFGLDIDGRAAQLAYFSVMMKAREYDRRFFSRGIQPNVYDVPESNDVDLFSVDYFCGNDSELRKDIIAIIDVLKDAKEYGSILHIPPINFKKINDRFKCIENEISIYNTYLLGDFKRLIRVAEILSQRYIAVTTNPPYLSKYDTKLKKHINTYYSEFSGDLFSVFMRRNFDFCKKDGYTGFMTPFVWMFIKAHEKVRSFILSHKTISTLVQMEYSAYEEATVPICAFVCQNAKPREKGLYIKLSEFKGGMDVQGEQVRKAARNPESNYLYEVDQNQFFNIPGLPVSYWASDRLFEAFATFDKVEKYYEVRNGITTGDNNAFLRLWFEVTRSSSKWFPCNKGGSYRKWSGNRDYVVDWEDEGLRLKTNKDQNGKVRATLRGIDFNFTAGITMSRITSGTPSFREMICDSISESATNAIYPKSKKREDSLGLMAMLNSAVGAYVLSLLNPTINVVPEDIRSIPINMDDLRKVVDTANNNCRISSEDWNSVETSWDFQRHPLLKWRNISESDRTVASQNGTAVLSPVDYAYTQWMSECDERFDQ